MSASGSITPVTVYEVIKLAYAVKRYFDEMMQEGIKVNK
jgi:hypothetical protein